MLFGFYMAAGHREKDRVASVSLRKITIGQLKGCCSNERLVREIFQGTRIRADYQPNMGDYLLCHAAAVVAIAFACYFCDGDLKRIGNNRAYLNRIIDAYVEGYATIENAGHEILPVSDKGYRSRGYRRLCCLFYRLICSTVIGKVCASDHALNAVEEMSALNAGLKRFFDAHQAVCRGIRRTWSSASSERKTRSTCFSFRAAASHGSTLRLPWNGWRSGSM